MIVSLERFLNFCDKKELLYVYGAGTYGRAIMMYLIEQNYDACFVETRPERKYIMGKPVLELSEIKIKNSQIIIAVGAKYREEILITLNKLGYTKLFVITQSLMSKIREETKYDIEINYEGGGEKKINVLIYHRVTNPHNDFWGISVSPSDFEEQIRYAKENYKILRFEDDWSNVQEKSLVFTFDDGYKDNYIWAMPILEKYQVPATFFISTGNIGRNREFWWDQLARIFYCSSQYQSNININGNQIILRGRDFIEEDLIRIHSLLKPMNMQKREEILDKLENIFKPTIKANADNMMMTEKELISLDSSPYVTIGGHTNGHPSLGKQSIEMQEKEIFVSKIKLEKILGHSITTFSYPFGGREDFTMETIDLVRKAGYLKAAANYQGVIDNEHDAFSIPRNKIYQGGRDAFSRQLNGIWIMLGQD